MYMVYVSGTPRLETNLSIDSGMCGSLLAYLRRFDRARLPFSTKALLEPKRIVGVDNSACAAPTSAICLR